MGHILQFLHVCACVVYVCVLMCLQVGTPAYGSQRAMVSLFLDCSPPCLFVKISFTLNYVQQGMCAHECGCLRSPEASDPPGAGVMGGTRSGSSGRATLPLKTEWALHLQPHRFLLLLLFVCFLFVCLFESSSFTEPGAQ